jgi:hypothetical protein
MHEIFAYTKGEGKNSRALPASGEALPPRKLWERTFDAPNQATASAEGFLRVMVALLIKGFAQKPTLRTNPNVT